MGSEILDVTVIYQTETLKAVCVREHEASREDIWIPKSMCEFYRPEKGGRAPSGAPIRRGDVIVLTAPETILMDKGLL